MTKAELRATFRAKRRALTEAAWHQQSDGIAKQTMRLLATQPVRWVHVFLPIEQQREVDTWALIRRVWTDLPAVETAAPRTDIPAQRLSHHILTPDTALIDNKWGIPEPPATSPTVPATLFDAVLVPLLAFDERGHRVGYGGGYYDRFLAECRPDCLKIGLSFFEPVERIDDVQPTDRQLDLCTTPQQVWRFRE